MAIKQKFQKQGEQTISTFDFSDIFALKGYVKFNAIRTNEGDFCKEGKIIDRIKHQDSGRYKKILQGY